MKTNLTLDEQSAVSDYLVEKYPQTVGLMQSKRGEYFYPSEYDVEVMAKIAEIRDPAYTGVTRQHVNTEKDRRIAGGFIFGGTTYQTDVESRANIAGIMPMAMAAIQGGAVAGDLRWLDPDEDFAWTAADNSRVPMDAPTCMAFSMEAARYKAALTKAASDIKDLSPIPKEYANDQYWPAGPSA